MPRNFGFVFVYFGLNCKEPPSPIWDIEEICFDLKMLIQLALEIYFKFLNWVDSVIYWCTLELGHRIYSLEEKTCKYWSYNMVKGLVKFIAIIWLWGKFILTEKCIWSQCATIMPRRLLIKHVIKPAQKSWNNWKYVDGAKIVIIKSCQINVFFKWKYWFKI